MALIHAFSKTAIGHVILQVERSSQNNFSGEKRGDHGGSQRDAGFFF